MGNDLKKILSQDVYKAYENIRGLAKELGGGHSKKEIDSVTEYQQLQALLNGQGQVERNKMTKTDVAALSTLLANAERWKPLGDDFECSGENAKNEAVNNEPRGKEVEKETKKQVINNQEGATPVKKSNKKPEESVQPEKVTVNNNSTTNNSGVNNSFNGNSGTIVIDNSEHVNCQEQKDSQKGAHMQEPASENKKGK